eukprot:scaffold1101_cov123-Cylindrotheca_fusiformis.AAC.1
MTKKGGEAEKSIFNDGGRKTSSTSKRKSGNSDAKSGKTGSVSELSNGGLEEIDAMFLRKKRVKADIKVETNANEKKRQTVSKSQPSPSRAVRNVWVDDGLGGKYNGEGFTGRIQDGCKVFKAHVLNKPNSGNSRDCPFDCDCCFI